jgi:hypothetical protein
MRSIIILGALGHLVAAPAALAQQSPPAQPTPPAQPVAPAPAPAPAAEAPALPAEPDVAALRQEYLRLREKLFQSRARAAAVGDTLYSTQLTVKLDYASARFHNVTRSAIRLDGAGVYDDLEGQIAADKAPRFTGFVAPGRHQIAIRIEAAGKDDDRFTSIIDDSFTIQAPAGKHVTVAVTARDDGDIPYAWKRSERGSYKLRLDVAVTTADRPGAKGAAK